MASIFKLSGRAASLLSSKISDAFDAIKRKLLGPNYGKSLLIGYERNLSLPGLYEAAVASEGGFPDLEALETAQKATDSYLEAAKLRAINQTKRELEEAVRESKTSTQVQKKLKESWEKITSNVETIVNTESLNAVNTGILQGIVRISTARNIEDPYIYFICVIDDKLCKLCERLHLLEDRLTPRVWKLSEVKAGFSKKDDGFPSIFSHVNCRCILAHVLPNFGFQNGKLSYISEGYDVLKDQRGE